MRFGSKKVLSRVWPPRVLGTLGYLPVVCYHSVNPAWNGDARPVTPIQFRQHLDMLSSEFRIVDLDTYHAAVLRDKIPLTRSVLVTFDDGFVDNYEVALPILQDFNAPATFFLATGFIDGSIDLIPDPRWRAISWGQAKEMKSSGLASFGAHTVTHRSLGTVARTEARWEVLESKKVMEDRLGSGISAFAFPNGQRHDMPRAAFAAVKEVGFDLAFSTLWSTVNRRSDQYRLSRVMIDHDDSVNDLRDKVLGRYDFLYHWHNRGWIRGAE